MDLDTGVARAKLSVPDPFSWENIMANEISAELEPRVIRVVQSMFKVSPSSIDGSLRMGEVAGWDSLGHMRLVNELESVFGITFPTYMLAEITDVPGIARAIDSLGGR